MKLVRYGEPGFEKPGIVGPNGDLRDLSKEIGEINGQTLAPETLSRLSDIDLESLTLVDHTPRLGPCVAAPGKFVAIGLNFTDHAIETGSPIPGEPIVFFKTDTCICGPNDDVMQPLDCIKLDWEVEIAIVIGTMSRNVAEGDAAHHIAGYCIVNDVSERSFQGERGGGQWGKGKGCDTFGPMGPWLVTKDEIEDVQNLNMWLDVNGERMQTGNTSTMIFGCEFLVSYLSRFMTLMPGDVITTGTPPGVAMGKKPPRWLQPGDIMTLGIDGLGEQAQTVVGYSSQVA